MDTIRLFVGTSANNEDLEAEAVLAYTAHKHCSLPLEITWMRQAATGPWSGWASNRRGRTPFTSYRWGVPAACGYEGKAIYTDVDFFFVADLAELWNQPVADVALVRNNTGKLSTSCMLFDCEQAKAHVPDIPRLKVMPDAHDEMLHYFRARPFLFGKFIGNWDCPDLSGSSLNDPQLKAVHYSRVETQLHLKHAVPRLKREKRMHWYTGEIRQHGRPELQAHFDALLEEATANDYPPERFRVTPYEAATRRDFTYSVHLGTKVAS